MLANQPIVIDNGSGVIKSGFAGGEVPSFSIPSFVGRPKHEKSMLQTHLDTQLFVGRLIEY
jgi:centractin